ncbi:MAG: PaaX family transcriptional regulator C-terminal domain-containing protein, partial [Bradyrhizobium sp.]|nr:PaaX family transcriptional regulator C-terminal domain-containing protein [Bradyrhizobium sp.]
SSIAVPDAVEGAIRLQASAGSDMARRLVAESWALERTAEAYRKFSASFAPLKSSIERGEALSDGQAFTARVLLIHHYRRIVLRDPLLPAELLPGNWPGRQARALCGEIYRLLLPGSERWLDAHAINEAGPLPAAAAALLRRFADVDEAP